MIAHRVVARLKKKWNDRIFLTDKLLQTFVAWFSINILCLLSQTVMNKVLLL